MTSADRPVGPVIVRRRLGSELRRLREDADLRLDAVAAELEVSPSKISRIETGHSTAKIWDVRNLLELYAVEPSKRDEVLGWAADAKAQAWWQPDSADSPSQLDYYISLEAEATTVMAFCTPVLHGLLQTEAYARAHLRTVLADTEPDVIERLVRVRLGRQTVLRQPNPLQLEVVVDESVLLRRIGSDDTMREQLRALTTPPPSTDIRVRPLDAGPHQACTSPFTIFVPRVSGLDPLVVGVEASFTDFYLERADDVAPFPVAFQELRSQSLDPESSAALIRSLADGPIP